MFEGKYPILYEHIGRAILGFLIAFIVFWLLIVLWNGVNYTFFYDKPRIEDFCSYQLFDDDKLAKFSAEEKDSILAGRKDIINCLQKTIDDFNND